LGKVDYGESIDVVKNLKTLLNHQINIPKHAILLKKVRQGSTSGITQAVFKNYRTLYVIPGCPFWSPFTIRRNIWGLGILYAPIPGFGFVIKYMIAIRKLGASQPQVIVEVIVTLKGFIRLGRHSSELIPPGIS
jgi:hypothetical protein